MKNRLPIYEPREELWEAIENQLPLRWQVKLKTYEPSENIWGEIIKEKKKYNWYWSAAAIMLISLCMSIFFTGKKNDVQFSEQKIKTELQLNIGDLDGNASLDHVCINKVVECNKIEVKLLKMEYDELNAAKKKLKDAMGAYNDDPELMSQWVSLENEKVKIYNKIISMI